MVFSKNLKHLNQATIRSLKVFQLKEVFLYIKNYNLNKCLMKKIQDLLIISQFRLLIILENMFSLSSPIAQDTKSKIPNKRRPLTLLQGQANMRQTLRIWMLMENITIQSIKTADAEHLADQWNNFQWKNKLLDQEPTTIILNSEEDIEII